MPLGHKQENAYQAANGPPDLAQMTSRFVYQRTELHQGKHRAKFGAGACCFVERGGVWASAREYRWRAV